MRYMVCSSEQFNFSKKLSKLLEECGFKPNDYDRCTFNKMVNGEQLTVQSHADKLQCSHIKQSVPDELINDLNDKFKTEK